MKQWVKRAVNVLVLGVVTVGVVLIVGMRTKNPKELRAVRNMNRAVCNPKKVETAGTPGASASIVRHVGRTLGKEYETPVGVVATDRSGAARSAIGSAHCSNSQGTSSRSSATADASGSCYPKTPSSSPPSATRIVSHRRSPRLRPGATTAAGAGT